MLPRAHGHGLGAGLAPARHGDAHRWARRGLRGQAQPLGTAARLAATAARARRGAR